MLKKSFSNKFAARFAIGVAMLMGTLMQAHAAAVMDPAVGTAIADAIAVILQIIGLGGAAYITIKLAVVGWNVGAKFIGRLGGKA